jgi:ribosome-associated protein
MTTDLHTEINYRTSRSSGAGGQNVNKVSTRVELLFNVDTSVLLTKEERTLIKTRLANKIDKEGVLRVISQESRSQLKNKETALKKFYALLEVTLKIEKARKPTKTPKSVIRARLENKKETAEKKKNRVKVKLHHYRPE